MTNNQGIFHLNLNGSVACKSRTALMYTPVAEFRTPGKRCKRCSAVLAKMDASAAKREARRLDELNCCTRRQDRLL
jgi:hypothetical protein